MCFTEISQVHWLLMKFSFIYTNSINNFGVFFFVLIPTLGPFLREAKAQHLKVSQKLWGFFEAGLMQSKECDKNEDMASERKQIMLKYKDY